jgi:hypothetical protein
MLRASGSPLTSPYITDGRSKNARRMQEVGLLDSSSSCEVLPRGGWMLRARISAGIGGVEPCESKVLGRRWKTRSWSSWVVSRERPFVLCGANASSAYAAHRCHEQNIPCTHHRVVLSPLPLRTSLPSAIRLTYSVPRAWNRSGRRGRTTGVRRDVFVVGVGRREGWRICLLTRAGMDSHTDSQRRAAGLMDSSSSIRRDRR